MKSSRFTVINEDSGRIQVSQALLKKLVDEPKQQEETNLLKPTATPKEPQSYEQSMDWSNRGSTPRSNMLSPQIPLVGLHAEYDRKLAEYQHQWREQWERLNELNQELFRGRRDQLNHEVDRVESTILRKHYLKESPCKELEETVLRCYQVHNNKPLFCGELVQQLSRCVEQARFDQLRHK